MLFCLFGGSAAFELERGECVYLEVFTVKMLRARLAYFQGPAATIPSCGSQMDLAEGRESGLSLSLTLSPDPDVLPHDAEVRPGTSSTCAEDDESLGSGLDYELPTSEHSSRDDKAVEELLKCLLARWPDYS